METSTTPSSSEAKIMPGAGELIKDSWHFFTSSWNDLLTTSRLFIGVGALYFLGGLLVQLNIPLAGLLNGLIALAGMILTFWITIRVWFSVIRLERDSKATHDEAESTKAWSLFFPMLWVSILTTLVVLGTTLLFIIPGIYFSVALMFSTIALVDQNIRGTQALATSRALIKGRWWGTFGRMLAGNIVFTLPIGILFGIVFGILGRISNAEGSSIPLWTSSLQFVQTLFMAALIPLLSGFQLKVYRALQKTR